MFLLSNKMFWQVMESNIAPDKALFSKWQYFFLISSYKTYILMRNQKYIYSNTTHLPWLIQTRFWLPRKVFNINSSRKQIFRDIFLSWKLCCVYSLELPHRKKYETYQCIFINISFVLHLKTYPTFRRFFAISFPEELNSPDTVNRTCIQCPATLK